jgi:transcriptional regulator with XRE-family HTH domain/predicted Fe-Mo cluster-binding NifX family protein
MPDAQFDPTKLETQTPAEVLVGRNLHDLRTKRGFSLRALAESSGLNANTLSLIENGKISPSVSTLQQLSLALHVPIATFFESKSVEKRMVFTPADQRPKSALGKTEMENLGKDLVGSPVQPFVVTLKPGAGSGESTIVHTGHEFVYCLTGVIHYKVEENDFILKPGDSLVFEAHLPHCWMNDGNETAQLLLILYPSDGREELGGRHFSINTIKKEISMKIAAITEDGKTISQHFGRAPYYLVLTIEDGKIVNREMRDKMGHNQFHEQAHSGESHEAGHGMDAQSHDKHVSMAQTIADCKALLCGGMGMGAYESMRRLNIQPVVTDLSDIDEAVQAFIDGKLIDHTELLH